MEPAPGALATSGGIAGSRSRLLIGRRAQATTAAPNREAYLNEFVRNRVYYQLRQKLAAGGVVWDVPDSELRRLGLAGGLLALVAHVSDGAAETERAAMVASHPYDLRAAKAVGLNTIFVYRPFEFGSVEFAVDDADGEFDHRITDLRQIP